MNKLDITQLVPLECSTKFEAVDLVRHCLETGKIVVSKHCRDELLNEDFDILDAHYVLKRGNIFMEPELDIRSGDWKYRMEGKTVDGRALAVVFCFKAFDTSFLITAFSISS